MRDLAQSLAEVMPDLITKPYENTLKQKQDLEKTLAELSEYGESLDTNRLIIPSSDPSLKFIAQDFKNELLLLKKNAPNQTIFQTRLAVRNLTRYCIACHTRTVGSSSSFSNFMKTNLEGYSSFEKAKYFGAIRQYEKAIIEFETAIKDMDWAQSNPNKWSEAAMNLLAITVRVKQNPNLTVELLSSFFDKESFPKSIYKAARSWQVDAKKWEAESKQEPNLTKVKLLLAEASKKEKIVKHSGLLLNLRASSILNTYLQQGILKASSEQALLYYSGVLAQRLGHLNFSEFPESYFKACISLNPNSNVAKACKTKL